jgi:hypoxanthine-guanine phosphoribosyltransferase
LLDSTQRQRQFSQIKANNEQRGGPVDEDGRGHRVLVVEDNVDVGQFSTQILQDLG